MATILIVDDRPLNRKFLMMLLSSENYKLLEANDGAEALRIAKTKSVDLIFTDILMPIMDGYELAEELHKDPKLSKIPIIFYTATYRKEDAKAVVKEYGINYVLSKPCEPQTILDTIHKALGTTQSASSTKRIPEISSLIPIVQSPDLSQIGNKLSDNFSEIETIKKDFKKIITTSKKTLQKHGFLTNNIKTLSENLKQVRDLSNQLVTIVEFNLDLIAESDPQKLLGLFCRGARKVLGAKYASLGILNTKGTKLKNLFLSGMDAKDKTSIRLSTQIDRGFIGRILKQNSIVKINSGSKIPKSDLPSNHPTVANFLGFPLLSNHYLYGFVYFADKIDGTVFSDEDTQIAQTLVSELSLLFDNFELSNSLQHHTTKLQLEIAERKKTQEKLSKSELLFRQFAENINEVFWRTNPEMTKVIYVSPSYKDIWGRSVESCYANPDEWFQSIVPEDQPMVKETFGKLMQGNVKKVNLEFKITRPDGAIRNIYSRGFQLKDERGKLISLLGISSDVTEYQKTKKYAEMLSEIVNVLENSKHFQEASPQILKTIGEGINWELGDVWILDPEEKRLRCIDIWQVDNIEAKSFIKGGLKQTLRQGIGLAGRVWQSRKSTWISNLARDSNFPRASYAKEAGLQSGFAVPISYKKKLYGVIEFFSLSSQEIDSKLLNKVENICARLGEFIHSRHTEGELKYLSHYDVLTGLMNRSFFEETITQDIKVTSPAVMGLIILDIDRFKLINETLKHKTGDFILQTVANKIQKVIRYEVDLCARLGADKFAIALTDVLNVEKIREKVIQINEIFNDPILVHNQDIFLAVSMGISVYPEDGIDITSLLQKAETALQEVKEEGGGHFQFSSANLASPSTDRLSEEMDLRKALMSNQFCVYYQPKVDLKTGYICGFEALIRWQHPEKGLLSPASFIQTAEESGLIVPIGEWVLREVCRQIKEGELIAGLDTPILVGTFAINVSVHQLTERHNLLEYIKKLINDFDINPNILEIEVTESVLAKDLDSSLKFLNAIKELGIKVALDDFGTGYSSLKYFQYFPIDRIKIDKSFIDGIPHNQQNLGIVRAITALSHSFGIKVIAEGVETKEQLECLIKEKCDELQGYYFSKPVSASEIKKMITEKKHLIL